MGNPVTGESVDFSSKVPFALGMGIISEELYEVNPSSHSGTFNPIFKCVFMSTNQ